MKFFLSVLFLCCCLVILSLSFFNRISEDKPVLKVVLTGMKEEEWVEWKNPQEALKSAYLPTYEVRLEKPDGKLLDSFFLYGDLVGIRAKVIRFTPFLNAIGIANIYQLETVYNGYSTSLRHNAYPACARPLNVSSSKLQCILWNFWEKLFVQQCHSSWIKSAALESAYFPLADQHGEPICKDYLLTISAGGLSSIAVKPKKRYSESF